MSYRKIWESIYGTIPPGYEIHHKDGNNKNNAIENLKCVSIEEHFAIHKSQKDYMACSIMHQRMSLSDNERKEIHRLAMLERDQSGSKNPMYGRSAIKEQNMKWYNNGSISKMFTENTQPDGFVKGRIMKIGTWDKSGSKNPMYGRSAIKEQKLRWYTNGKRVIYVPENTQPKDFIRGRKIDE